jgi:hypothetical protein
MSATNPIQTDQGLNPDLRSAIPATNHLSYDTTARQFDNCFIFSKCILAEVVNDPSN